MFLEPDERLVLAWQVIEISNQCDHSHKKRHSHTIFGKDCWLCKTCYREIREIVDNNPDVDWRQVQ